jgi:hypothetical protein
VNAHIDRAGGLILQAAKACGIARVGIRLGDRGEG